LAVSLKPRMSTTAGRLSGQPLPVHRTGITLTKAATLNRSTASWLGRGLREFRKAAGEAKEAF